MCVSLQWPTPEMPVQGISYMQVFARVAHERLTLSTSDSTRRSEFSKKKGGGGAET